MSKTMDTSQWIQFFRKAGLPPNVAANYALIFFDNRIQVDMLLDLSKEYLYDMDIKVMGDVIAILKYAKEFHNQLAKERVIGNTMSKTSVAERMVGRYARPIAASPVHGPTVTPSSVRAPAPQSQREFQKKPKIISLKRKAEEEFPQRKIRRVPPEEEGGYKIKMPLGTTERTRKILQQQQQGTKRSVFARLGESSVSSSTDSKATSSVFERLGPSGKNIGDNTPSSTVLDRPSRKDGPLQYKGVLKMTVGKNRTVTSFSSKQASIGSRTVIRPVEIRKPNITKTVRLNEINTILQANKSPGSRIIKTGGQGIFGHRAQNLNIKSRLGGKIDSRNLARTRIIQSKKKVLVKNSSNVFDRLGR
ncbi:uncharacterized protein C19orf47 homolog [Caerostris darwini]|uniref:Uncharacterized protein C19orf47 homolog n=1 Tax=Caerostris darwini TaxID=1538125 RepID=A0AAV4U922_9ARAC|nr:uncharacterized protein C19orf47 homolog [Caerostris darwini]